MKLLAPFVFTVFTFSSNAFAMNPIFNHTNGCKDTSIGAVEIVLKNDLPKERGIKAVVSAQNITVSDVSSEVAERYAAELESGEIEGLEKHLVFVELNIPSTKHPEVTFKDWVIYEVNIAKKGVYCTALEVPIIVDKK